MRISDWSSDVCSSDLLIDCQPRDRRQLICLRETSLKPRHLAAIDLDRGRAHIIADFNPEFSRLKMGRAQRIMLTSSVGIQAFGDLVYPADYRAGQRYPLIRSEEHTSELQSLMRISYAVFCLKKKKNNT